MNYKSRRSDNINVAATNRMSIVAIYVRSMRTRAIFRWLCRVRRSKCRSVAPHRPCAACILCVPARTHSAHVNQSPRLEQQWKGSQPHQYKRKHSINFMTNLITNTAPSTGDGRMRALGIGSYPHHIHIKRSTFITRTHTNTRQPLCTSVCYASV